MYILVGPGPLVSFGTVDIKNCNSDKVVLKLSENLSRGNETFVLMLGICI